MAFDEDLDQFFTDFTVSATFGGETAQVLFEYPDQVVLAGEVLTAEYQITFPAGTFAALTYGSQITVNGAAYTAHPPQAIEDGRLMIARLTKNDD